MNRTVAGAWWGMVAVLCDHGTFAAAPANHAFSSSAGYSLHYPARWTPMPSSSGRLLILSSGRRMQGPVIGPDQAAILVRVLGPGEGVPVAAKPAALHTPSCPQSRENETREAGEPGPVAIVRSLYCIGGSRMLLVQLTYWADDPRPAVYRRATDMIAASIRLRPR